MSYRSEQQSMLGLGFTRAGTRRVMHVSSLVRWRGHLCRNPLEFNHPLKQAISMLPLSFPDPQAPVRMQKTWESSPWLSWDWDSLSRSEPTWPCSWSPAANARSCNVPSSLGPCAQMGFYSFSPPSMVRGKQSVVASLAFPLPMLEGETWKEKSLELKIQGFTAFVWFCKASSS